MARISKGNEVEDEHTQNCNLDVLGGLAKAVSSSQGINGTIGSLGLLDDQGALIIGDKFIDMLIIVQICLNIWFVKRSFLPDKRRERTALNPGVNINIKCFCTLEKFFELDGWST